MIADVSYSAPNSQGYKLPSYWRMTFWGRLGSMEFNYAEPGVRLALDGETEPRIVPPDAPDHDYLDAFLADVAGTPTELNTEHILEISRKTLVLQEFANRSQKVTSL